MSDSLWPYGLYSPWNSLGQNTGVVSLSLLQGSSQPRNWTQISYIAGGFFTSWATREAQEYWSGEPIPSPGNLPDPGIKPGSPALQADSYTNWAIREMNIHVVFSNWREFILKLLWTSRDKQFSSHWKFSFVQSLSCVWLCNPMNHSMPGLPVHHLEFTQLMSIESVMPSSHLILCRPLLLLPPSPPSIRVFSNEPTLGMRWPKYWSFSFSISPSKEHAGLNSFRLDWLDLLAVQGTLKSLLQHHSSKASILLCSVFYPVQLSHPYMTTGKTIALTRQTELCWQSSVSAF